jgi:cystathionine gamma-synthase
MRIESLAIHAGAETDAATGAVAPPIHLSTTFQHGPAGERLAGYEYTREGNPTQTRLEEALAALERGASALAFGSGMAATDAILSAFPDGSHILIPRDVYHGTRVLAREFLARLGIRSDAVDITNAATVAAAVTPQTRCIWIETPSNPLLQIADIAVIAEIAHRAKASLVVDSTFATPCLQQPLMLGADVVMHSTTKYFGGHSDVAQFSRRSTRG